MIALIKRFIGFGLTGVICTITTVIMIYFFDNYTSIGPVYSYIISYGLTIILSYTLNAKFVFESRYAVMSLIGYVSVYVSSMGIGVVLINLLQEISPLEDWITSCMTIPVTMAWNFVLGHFIFK